MKMEEDIIEKFIEFLKNNNRTEDIYNYILNSDNLNKIAILSYISNHSNNYFKNLYNKIIKISDKDFIKNIVTVEILNGKSNDEIIDKLSLSDKDNLELHRKKIYKEIIKQFPNIYNYIYSDRYYLLNEILSNAELEDSDYLQYIYDEIIKKDNHFLSYDFNTPTRLNPFLLLYIRGIISDIDEVTLRNTIEILNRCYNIDEENNEMFFNNYFDAIYEKNKDNNEDLYLFFHKLSEIISNTELEKKILIKKDYYNKYSDSKNYNILKENIINDYYKNIIHNNNIIWDAAINGEFLNREKELYDLYMNSDNEEYKRNLIVTIAITLAEKLKKEDNLDYTIHVTNDTETNNTIGYYETDDKTSPKVYINPSKIYLEEDVDYAYIKAIDTIYHEITHARQDKDMIEAKFSFKTLIQSIDDYLSDNLEEHNKYNYNNLSYEQEARENAYYRTMIYFKDKPNFQEIEKKYAYEKIDNMSKFIRKINSTRFTVIIDEFINTVNANLYISSLEGKKKDSVLDELHSYPVFELFFDYDIDNNKIKLKDKEYFDNIKEEFNNKPDSYKKREVLYTIKCIEYSLKLSEYNEINSMVGEYEKVSSDIIENIGEAPKVTKI